MTRAPNGVRYHPVWNVMFLVVNLGVMLPVIASAPNRHPWIHTQREMEREIEQGRQPYILLYPPVRKQALPFPRTLPLSPFSFGVRP